MAHGGSGLIVPLFATIIFVYGGFPFLSMAAVELRQRQPTMMTLIALAFSAVTIRVPSDEPRRSVQNARGPAQTLRP